MNKFYPYESETQPLFDYTEIPEQLNNITLAQEQRKRMACGFDSGLIKDMLFENGHVVDVKLSAIKNADGDIEISYNERRQGLRVPKKVLGHLLNEEQKNLLLNGLVIGPIRYKGQHYFVGVDEQLNKVTVRTDRQIGIPKTIGGYTLDAHDAYTLANRKSTDLRVFQTSKGDFFTAKVLMAENKNGIEFLDIKYIDKANAKALIQKLNQSKDIPDAVTLQREENERKEDDTAAKSRKTILTKGRRVQKTVKSQENVVYEQVTGSADSFTIDATRSFVPKVFKGVKLTEQQRRDMAQFKPVKIYGVNTKKGKANATVQLLKSGGINIDYSPTLKEGLEEQSKSMPFDQSF